MTKILVNSQGKALLTGSGKPLTKVSGGGGHTGTVDTAGLTALGWDAQDIQWLQDHVWWDAEDDAEWAVTEANKAFGPTGATPLTWSTKNTVMYNPDVRYLPKITPPASGNISNSFYKFCHLVAIPTHGWDMSGITVINGMFNECAALRSVGDLTQWNTAALTQMTSAFRYCCSMESVDISGWDFSNVTTMAEAFFGCSSLKELKVPSIWNAPKLTAMNGFIRASALENISISITAPLLTNISNFAYQATCLRSIKLSISGSVLSNIANLMEENFACLTVDLTGIDNTSMTQSGIGSAHYLSPLYLIRRATTIKLGPDFFKGTFTTLYARTTESWTRDSIYESLYTNQTGRDSNSNAVTIELPANAYDRLSASDLSDIATKNFTLTRV